MVTTDVSKRHSDRIWAENVVAKGQAIYAEKIRPSLTEADKGKYITVHTETN